VEVNERLLGPSPALAPEDVVAGQLQALQQPDEPYPDAGIEVAYAFASPAYKVATGGLARFAALIHTAPLRGLLCYATVSYGPLRIDADHAEQEVLVADHNGETNAYAFMLTRQRSGPLAGCWMTDAILRL
jgi:Domain of unknown function (DUF4864)